MVVCRDVSLGVAKRTAFFLLSRITILPASKGMCVRLCGRVRPASTRLRSLLVPRRQREFPYKLKSRGHKESVRRFDYVVTFRTSSVNVDVWLSYTCSLYFRFDWVGNSVPALRSRRLPFNLNKNLKSGVENSSFPPGFVGAGVQVMVACACFPPHLDAEIRDRGEAPISKNAEDPFRDDISKFSSFLFVGPISMLILERCFRRKM